MAGIVGIRRSRDSAVSWADSNGGLWLFGGNVFRSQGTTKLANDLWKYDIGTNEWTWVSGSDQAESENRAIGRLAASAGVPGARSHAVSWVNPDGGCWLFGGYLTKTRQITPDFNAFCVLYALELPLSRMIGELLKPNGSHAQGRLFLDLFLERFLREKNLARKGKNVIVELEYSIPNGGRIDILIDIDKKYCITIENKPYATDLEEQIHRYHGFMSRNYDEHNLFILYLSRDGSLPSEDSLPKEEREDLGDRFRVIKYSEIRDWCNSCALEASKAGAARLCTMIEEFSEFISREFCGVNTLKNKILGGAIEKNILEAFEMSQLWQKNKDQLETHWRETVNSLFNEELPRLVFERLKKDGVIANDWEWIKGRFDITTLHIEGVRFKKKAWRHFEIGLLSDRFKYEKGIRGFFPAIISKKKIRKEGYLANYYKQTGTVPLKNPFLQKPQTQWYADFPDECFMAWGYEQWKGIRPEGATVTYVADFLKKLIRACVDDIDQEEERLKGLG
ncbi:MAG: hypothetical protein GX465_12530 [Acidobacteria bacterium]|nr:hypothetical protein [Acidobacteriota bacterium]